MKLITQGEIDKYVMEKVNEHYNYLLNFYPKQSIFAVCAYGSMNYGFFKIGESDVDTKAIIIPTLHEVMFEKPISKELHLPDKSHIGVKDIRLMAQMWLKQNINFVEMFYTDYKIDNTHGFTKYFCNLKDDIAFYDRNQALQSIGGQTLHTIKQCLNEPTPKKFHNCERLYSFLADYVLGLDYEACLQPKGILHTNLYALKFDTIMPINWKNRLKDLEENIKKIMTIQFPVNKKKQEDTKKKLEDHIMYICQDFWEFCSGEIGIGW